MAAAGEAGLWPRVRLLLLPGVSWECVLLFSWCPCQSPDHPDRQWVWLGLPKRCVVGGRVVLSLLLAALWGCPWCHVCACLVGPGRRSARWRGPRPGVPLVCLCSSSADVLSSAATSGSALLPAVSPVAASHWAACSWCRACGLVLLLRVFPLLSLTGLGPLLLLRSWCFCRSPRGGGIPATWRGKGSPSWPRGLRLATLTHCTARGGCKLRRVGSELFSVPSKPSLHETKATVCMFCGTFREMGQAQGRVELREDLWKKPGEGRGGVQRPGAVVTWSCWVPGW